jgi:hypothetical protein
LIETSPAIVETASEMTISFDVGEPIMSDKVTKALDIVRDPFGHHWSMATRIEDLSPRQQQKRAKEFNAEHADRPTDAGS